MRFRTKLLIPSLFNCNFIHRKKWARPIFYTQTVCKWNHMTTCLVRTSTTIWTTSQVGCNIWPSYILLSSVYAGIIDFAVDSFQFRQEFLEASKENLQAIAENFRQENPKKFRKKKDITFVGIHNRRGDHLDYQKEGGYVMLDPGYFLNVSAGILFDSGLNVSHRRWNCSERSTDASCLFTCRMTWPGAERKLKRDSSLKTSTLLVPCLTPSWPHCRSCLLPTTCPCWPSVTTPSPPTAPTASGPASWLARLRGFGSFPPFSRSIRQPHRSATISMWNLSPANYRGSILEWSTLDDMKCILYKQW